MRRRVSNAGSIGQQPSSFYRLTVLGLLCCLLLLLQLHLHGHWFTVMAGGLPNAGKYAGQPLRSGVWRDTVTVNAGSYIVLRYIAANPGAWIFHCQ